MGEHAAGVADGLGHQALEAHEAQLGGQRLRQRGSLRRVAVCLQAQPAPGEGRTQRERQRHSGRRPSQRSRAGGRGPAAQCDAHRQGNGGVHELGHGEPAGYHCNHGPGQRLPPGKGPLPARVEEEQGQQGRRGGDRGALGDVRREPGRERGATDAGRRNTGGERAPGELPGQHRRGERLQRHRQSDQHAGGGEWIPSPEETKVHGRADGRDQQLLQRVHARAIRRPLRREVHDDARDIHVEDSARVGERVGTARHRGGGQPVEAGQCEGRDDGAQEGGDSDGRSRVRRFVRAHPGRVVARRRGARPDARRCASGRAVWIGFRAGPGV